MSPPARPLLIRTAQVPARVGLVGNPSDGFGGAVLATVVPGHQAEVSARPAADVRLGQRRWPSPAAWLDHVAGHGHGDDERIVSAAVWRLAQHVGSALGVHIEWGTTIPRSVGLAGSSALAVGAIESTAAAWETPLDRRVVAALALSAEADVLGIAAGWQDRVAQSFRRTVLVDAEVMEVVDGVQVPAVETFDGPLPVRLVVGWLEGAAAPSDGYHGALRVTPDRIAPAMRELAGLARSSFAALRAGDVDALLHAVDAAWSVRQAAAPLRSDHTRLVVAVRATGVTATTPGSGGSVVAIARDGAQVRRAIAALEGAGAAHLVW